MERRAWWALVLAACTEPAVVETIDTPPPQIVETSLACDAEVGRWRLEIETDAWAGGSGLLWTADGLYVEEHTSGRSVGAALDGSADLVRLDMGIATDFRDQGGDGITLFSCAAMPETLVWVYDLDGEVADCATLHAVSGVLGDVEGLPSCPEPDGDADA